MQFHILDENFTPVAIMDNTLSEAIHFKNSKFQRFAVGSADFLDFETDKLHVDSKMFQVGYWIYFQYKNRDNYLYINEISEAEKSSLMQISASSANLDLNLELMSPPQPASAQPISWYFTQGLGDTGYTIGINEISNLSRKLSWESEKMTRRAFLQSVANQFDNAELDYEVVGNSDFTIEKRLVHIKKQVGEVREDIELEFGKEVKTIKRKTTLGEGFCTAVSGISKDSNDKVTTIASCDDWQELDDDGNVKFFHKNGEGHVKAPLANARYGNRGLNVTAGGYIAYELSYDGISQSELFTRCKTYLKENSVPNVEYEVEGTTDANVGDTVTLIDNDYKPPLLLSARTLDIIVSFDNPALEKANFGDYKVLQSQISSDLAAKMQALAEQNAPYKSQTLTTNGTVFKNSEGSTVLTARLYKGNKEIIPDSFKWFNGTSQLLPTGNQLTVNASTVNQKAVYRWEAVINDTVVAFDEATIIDVSDGQTPFIHKAWANSADGTVDFTRTYPLENIYTVSKKMTAAVSGRAETETQSLMTVIDDPDKVGGKLYYRKYNPAEVSPTSYTHQQGIWLSDQRIIPNFVLSEQLNHVYTVIWKAKANSTEKVNFLWHGGTTLVAPTKNYSTDWQTFYAIVRMGTGGGKLVGFQREPRDTTFPLETWIKDIKVIDGDIRQLTDYPDDELYTPSPYDPALVSIDEYSMKYVGEYSDNNPESSANPANYTWQRLLGDKGDDAYRVEVISSKGLQFKNSVITTVLSARLYRGDEDITAKTDANCFKWTRVSDDTTGDTAWNAAHFSGTKQITVTTSDVFKRATFSCSVEI
jgi:hypothetical protein